jgi:hypothetical protein
VIATGVLDLRVSLELAVGAVAVALTATALVAAAWQGYAKLPPGHATPECHSSTEPSGGGRAAQVRLHNRALEKQVERLAHEVSPSPRCHGTARDFVLGPTARPGDARRNGHVRGAVLACPRRWTWGRCG